MDELKLRPGQIAARNTLAGLIGKERVGGRTLACLIGAQGSGKTVLANAICADPAFGEAKRVACNRVLLESLSDKYPELVNLPAVSFAREIKRFGQTLRADVYQAIREQILDAGLTVLDHLELFFFLGVNPVTMWYGDAVGRRRVLLVLTGRMAGNRCQIGNITLTRADQPIVELETVL